MATKTWIGGAAQVAQVTGWLFGGAWETTDVINITIGTHTVSVVAGSTTIATIVDTVLAALNASEIPEFAEITWSRSTSTLVGTADSAGIPFTATVSTTETGGGAADAQTIDGGASSDGVDSTACSGPYFADVASNWSGASLPVDIDDLVFANSAMHVRYGLANSAVTPASITIEQSFTGDLGLPATNDNGYYEYRTRNLEYCSSGDAINTTVTIGRGEGQGPGRVHLNTGSGQVTMNVLGAGNPPSGEPVNVFWKGTHASNAITINKGSLAAAFYPGEVATIATLRVGYQASIVGDAKVVCSSGCTLTTVNMSGGTVQTESAFTTLNMSNGELTHLAGAVTTMSVDAGTVFYRATSTLTTLNLASGGTFDLRQDMRGRTITNINFYEGFQFQDPFGTVTATNGYDFIRTSPGNQANQFIVPDHLTWTPTSI